MDLKDFLNLNHSKKAYHLTREYYKKCTSSTMYINGKLSDSFYKIRRTFLNADDTDLNNMYCFLDGIKGKQCISLKFLWEVAQEWNAEKKQEINHHVGDYKRLSIGEALDML